MKEEIKQEIVNTFKMYRISKVLAKATRQELTVLEIRLGETIEKLLPTVLTEKELFELQSIDFLK